MAGDEEILFDVEGVCGTVLLNRPRALNAVTDGMIAALSGQLSQWEADPAIKRVVVRAAGEKAFSAGGDIRHLYERGKAGDPDFGFFAREYRFNYQLSQFSKPYIALIDGIVMGGGVGVSFHGSHRIAGDGIAFAMPECGIGFFPDVGGSKLLSGLPGHVGLYLGLTGARVKRDDAVLFGLATHAVSSDQFSALADALTRDEPTDAIVLQFAVEPSGGTVSQQRNWIDEAFSGESVEVILQRLEAMANDGGEYAFWAEKTRDTLLQKSPTSLKVALRQIRAGADISMRDCMAMEYRILRRLLAGPDFYEGIRAAIIDKDGAPNWQPDSLEAVSDAEIDACFAPLGEDELFS